MSEKNIRIVTQLVLDFDMIHAFGPHGSEDSPIDAGPFCYLTLSQNEYAWGNSGVLELKPDESLELVWSIRVFTNMDENQAQNIEVKDIELMFRAIDSEAQMGAHWTDVFKTNDFLKGKSLVEPVHIPIQNQKGSNLLINPISELITLPKTGVPNNLSYSISFTILGPKQKDSQTQYHLRLDPLIKNNSNHPK